MKTLYKIHAWLGLFTGLFLVVICVTGSAAVFKPQVERLEDPGLLAVDDRGPRLTVDEAVHRLKADRPEAELLGVVLPRDAGAVYQFTTKPPGARTQVVTMDPHTGRVLGARIPVADSWANWLRQFHVRLFMGKWGRVFVGCFGITLLISTITGLVLFPKFTKGKWLPKIRRDRGARILWADLHMVVGLWSVLFNVMFAITGAVLGIEVASAKLHSNPAGVKTGFVPTTTPSQSLPLTELVARAEAAIPGTHASRISLPVRTKTKTNPAIRVQLDHPDVELVRESASFATLDPSSGNVITYFDARNASLLRRAYFTFEPLHFGRLGGLWWQLLWALMGLTGAFLSISGYVIYVLRKVKKPAKRRAAKSAPSPVESEAEGMLVFNRN